MYLMLIHYLNLHYKQNYGLNMYRAKQGTSEEGWRTQQLKRCVSNYHTKNEDNSPKNQNQNNAHEASFQKF